MSKFISLDDAKKLTGKYRTEREEVVKPDLKGKKVLAISETFEKDQILQILARDGCVALRVYYGMDSEKKVHAILVGVNAQDRDILPNIGVASTATVAG